jgi:hypothetical protein
VTRGARARDVVARRRSGLKHFAERMFEQEKLYFLNKTALNFEHESCRSSYPITFSQ